MVPTDDALALAASIRAGDLSARDAMTAARGQRVGDGGKLDRLGPRAEDEQYAALWCHAPVHGSNDSGLRAFAKGNGDFRANAVDHSASRCLTNGRPPCSTRGLANFPVFAARSTQERSSQTPHQVRGDGRERSRAPTTSSAHCHRNLRPGNHAITIVRGTLASQPEND